MTPQALAGTTDIPVMNACEPTRRHRRVRTLRRLVLTLTALLGLLPPSAMPESRITVLPAQGSGGRGASASAGLRIEVNVTRVLGLQAPSAAGSSAWTNGGTVVLGCVGQAACVSRAAGTSGASLLQSPTNGQTFAQP